MTFVHFGCDSSSDVTERLTHLTESAWSWARILASFQISTVTEQQLVSGQVLDDIQLHIILAQAESHFSRSFKKKKKEKFSFIFFFPREFLVKWVVMLMGVSVVGRLNKKDRPTQPHPPLFTHHQPPLKNHTTLFSPTPILHIPYTPLLLSVRRNGKKKKLSLAPKHSHLSTGLQPQPSASS